MCLLFVIRVCTFIFLFLFFIFPPPPSLKHPLYPRIEPILTIGIKRTINRVIIIIIIIIIIIVIIIIIWAIALAAADPPQFSIFHCLADGKLVLFLFF